VFDAPERLGGRVHRLCGPASYSFKTLAQLVLRETGRSRLLAPLPPAAAAFLAKFGDVQAAVLPLAPILTSDQLAQLDGAGDEGADLRALGVTPTPLEAVLPSYLWRFRKGGQFAELVSAAE
jgi:NADH dehydrogenase